MGKTDKIKSITVISSKKIRKIAKDKFGMSDEGIERAKDIGKVLGISAIAFAVGKAISNSKYGDSENEGKNTITAIGGQVSNNTTSHMIGKDAIVSKDGGVVIKKLVVNGAINVDM